MIIERRFLKPDPPYSVPCVGRSGSDDRDGAFPRAREYRQIDIASRQQVSVVIPSPLRRCSLLKSFSIIITFIIFYFSPLQILRDTEGSQVKDPEFAELERKAGLAHDDADSMVNEQMQTFVFSATLSKELQTNLRRRQRHFARSRVITKGRGKGKDGDKPASTLGEYLRVLVHRWFGDFGE